MNQVRHPKFTITYNNKDVTADITPYIISITYKDATEEKSDEIQIQVTNSSNIWLNEWYTKFKDKLQLSIGWPELEVNVGTFEVDEPTFKFGPDIAIIKAQAAGISKPTRTRRSDQHENKTLAQIAKKVADRYGYTIAGTIMDTGQIARVTQNMDTDLTFLRRLAKSYGHLFSVRANKITFTSIYDIEALAAATIISKSDFLPGSEIKDKSADTYKKAHLKSFDPKTKKVYESTFEFPEVKNVDGFTYTTTVKDDVKEVRTRVNSEQEGQQKLRAALHSSNSKQQEGKFYVLGNPLLVAGNNVEITEIGILSGVYHIVSSTHTIVPEVGYITEIDVKRVGFINIEKTKPKKPKKHKPVVVTVVK